MGLELRKGRNGKLRKRWYGRFDVDGVAHVVHLIPFKGVPPASGRITDSGNKAFEKSREDAKVELEKAKANMQQKGRAAHLVERMIEVKTGQKVEHTRVDELYARWRANSPGCEAHAKHAEATFTQFAEHVEKNQAGALRCYQVTRKTVEGWAEKLRTSLTASTARRKLRLLKTAFARVLPVGAANPFDPLPWTHGAGAGEEIPRQPLTEEELARLIETAKRRAPILHPLIVCAAYSGLRRGDVCRLKWSAVDLRTGELLLRTSKTGERVAIPILPPLREALAEAAANRNPGQECVWPLAARMIEENPNGLTLPFKKIAAEAAGRVLIAHEPGDATGLTPLADILPAVENRVATRYCGDKLLRMLDVLRRYAAGQSAKQIGKETGRQTARITETLRAAERWAGQQFLPDPNNTVWRKRMIAETTRRARPQGARAASVIDWHCLRTTFVTRALCGGMRVEDLQTLTGHRIVETVLKHYYRPPTAHIRVALEKAMTNSPTPPALTAGADAKLGTLLAGLTGEERKKLAAMLAK